MRQIIWHSISTSFLANSFNVFILGNNDSSGYSSGSSRPVSSRRSSGFEVNNLDQTTQNSQQSKQGFFEAYDCPRCGNIHRKGTVCQQIIEAYDCTRCGNIHRKGMYQFTKKYQIKYGVVRQRWSSQEPAAVGFRQVPGSSIIDGPRGTIA